MEILLILLFLFIALSVHEFAHAYVADKLGDSTPRLMGRVTLNPIKHMDPIGTFLLVVTMLSPGPAFGWGKPVVFNPYNLKNPKRDAGLVALAGPVSNIILASLSILILYLTKDPLLLSLLIPFIQLNVVLAVFNLIPIYPLDGYNIMVAFLPHHLSEQFQETSRYGVYILLLLVLTGAISKILYPVLSLVQYLINTLVF